VLSRSDLVINLSVVQMRLIFSFLLAQSVLCFLLLASYLDSVRDVYQDEPEKSKFKSNNKSLDQKRKDAVNPSTVWV